MKFILLLLLFPAIFWGCESSDYEVRELQNEKNELQLKVESLESEIAELKKDPDDALSDVKNNIKNGDFVSAKNTLINITSRQLSSRRLNEINKLLSAVNNRLEENDFRSLSENDTSFYSDFILSIQKVKIHPS